LFRRRSRSFPPGKARLHLACNKLISSGRRLSNPRLSASSSNSVPLMLARRMRPGAGSSTSAACASPSRQGHRIWLGASVRWRGARRTMPYPIGRSLRSLHLRSPRRPSRTAARSLLWHGTVPHAEWPVYVETSQAEWLLTLSRCGVAARNSRVPAIRERYCRARHDRKSTRVSFSLSRPTRPGDEIGGEVSASRTWWSTAARRWRGVDCQDAPAIRECLER
jgi:hypothetical protein